MDVFDWEGGVLSDSSGAAPNCMGFAEYRVEFEIPVGVVYTVLGVDVKLDRVASKLMGAVWELMGMAWKLSHVSLGLISVGCIHDVLLMRWAGVFFISRGGLCRMFVILWVSNEEGLGLIGEREFCNRC